MNPSFAVLAANFIGFQILWFAAVYGAAQSWHFAGWAVLVAMQLAVWSLGQPWRRDVPLLAAGAVACLLLEPLWLATGLIGYVNWQARWLAPEWIWALWLGFAVSFNYCLAWLRRRPWLGALFGGLGGVFSVTVGMNLGAAEFPRGWLPLALVYGAVWALVVPALGAFATRQKEN